MKRSLDKRLVLIKSLCSTDTPWDEPSTASPEYKAYLSGELLQYEPWSNIPPDALCKRPLHPDRYGLVTEGLFFSCQLSCWLVLRLIRRSG